MKAFQIQSEILGEWYFFKLIWDFQSDLESSKRPICVALCLSKCSFHFTYKVALGCEEMEVSGERLTVEVPVTMWAEVVIWLRRDGTCCILPERKATTEKVDENGGQTFIEIRPTALRHRCLIGDVSTSCLCSGLKINISSLDNHEKSYLLEEICSISGNTVCVIRTGVSIWKRVMGCAWSV
jgi:hypothetical protein